VKFELNSRSLRSFTRNANKPPIKVRHQDLVLWDPESSCYKVMCPVKNCHQGLLLVRRDQKKNFIIESRDRCHSCSQEVIYTDIVFLRKVDRGELNGWKDRKPKGGKDAFKRKH
jgi:hypothetical protein